VTSYVIGININNSIIFMENTIYYPHDEYLKNELLWLTLKIKGKG
jgi:hypothetical protein